MNKVMYDRLAEIAQRRGYTTYADVAPLVGLDMEIDADRNQMSILLEEIARFEEGQHRPLLTAVVIHRQDNIPGEGFFKIAKEFGRFDGGDKLRFWIDALNEVHDCWARKENT
jgi:hypothetical protein